MVVADNVLFVRPMLLHGVYCLMFLMKTSIKLLILSNNDSVKKQYEVEKIS